MEEEIEETVKENDMKPILIKDLGMLYPTENSKKKSHYGIFKCQYCGKEFRATLGHVKRGNTKSCGCQIKGREITHGLANHRFYNKWNAMMQRCSNIKHKQYIDYGARGIRVCEEWQDVRNFVKWVNETYIEGMSLDRRDNDKGYSPENCRWTDGITQSVNQRKKKNNTSGYAGVSWYKDYNKWVSIITFNKKRIDLGYYDNIEAAVKVRDEYIKEHNLPHKLSTEY